MRINHNLAALNTYNQLSANNDKKANSLEKLSSGLRINRAGDDAAGLAISEKMRGQIRGLEQASRNSQDGISMIQTAEGALNETHSILQRMRELATQAASDTNADQDRAEIQKEINQLSSEINRIGNTTEFNTQSLLKGDGGVSLESSGIVANATLTEGADVQHTEATTDITVAAGDISVGDGFTIDLNGITVTFATANTGGTAGDITVSGDTATMELGAATLTVTQDEYGGYVESALQSVIDNNETLSGNYEVSYSGGNVTISAVSGGDFEGAAGNISGYSETQDTNTLLGGGTDNTGSTTAATADSYAVDLTGYTTTTDVDGLVGKGFTLEGTQFEFYNANDGDYTGDAVGINVSDAYAAGVTVENVLGDAIASQLNSTDGISVTSDNAGTVTITSDTTGADSSIAFTDGGVQAEFQATFQVGANKSQSFTVEINDMRANALGVTGEAGADGFTATNTVTDGTNNTTSEAALDVSSYESATAAIKTVNNAIETVSAERSKLGAYQNRLEHTINNLGTSAENLTAAESRIRDVDMAKEMMQFTKNNILSQAAQGMLAQANQAPQGVLQLLR